VGELVVECKLDLLVIENPETKKLWDMSIITPLCAEDTSDIPTGKEQPEPAAERKKKPLKEQWPPTVPYPEEVKFDEDDGEDADPPAPYDPADPLYATGFSDRWEPWKEHPLLVTLLRIANLARHALIFDQVKNELAVVLSGTSRDKLTSLWPGLRQQIMDIDTMIAKPLKEEKAKQTKWEAGRDQLKALFGVMRQARKDKDAADAKEAAHFEALEAQALIAAQEKSAPAEQPEVRSAPRKPFFCLCISCWLLFTF
jgi:hypothetical protein